MTSQAKCANHFSTAFGTQPEVLIGNHFLFYVAATLAAGGYDVDFVPERGKQREKTPDLRAAKNGKVIWIETNAKQPKRTVDNPERLSQLIRDIIDEKKRKFRLPEYWPGMIVADISPAHHLINESGSVPFLKLRQDLVRPLTRGSIGDGFIYPLYEDREWDQHLENQGNIFAYLIREFAGIDRLKYNVTQCLLTVTRQVWRDGSRLAFPKGHQLVVCRSAEADALSELSRHIYLV